MAGVVIVLLGRLLGARVWADTHSGAFNDPRWVPFSRVNDWVMRRCAGVIVTNGPLADRVERAGGRPFLLNLVSDGLTACVAPDKKTIVAPLSYSFDEPVRELLAAIAMAPEVHVTLTGRAPDWVHRLAPANCSVSGWLSTNDYERLLGGAAGVICLTSRDFTMQMSAFEAIEYGRPILASGTSVLRDYLDQGGTVFVHSHDPGTLASALRDVWQRQEELAREATAAQRVMFARAELELGEVEAALLAPVSDLDDREGGSQQFTDGRRTALWRSALVVFAGNSVARALGFVFPVLLAHLLRRDDFALAYFFINGGFFVAELVTASFATAMIRHIAAEQDRSRQGRWLVAAIVRGLPMVCLAAIVGETVSLVAGAPPLLMTAMVVGLSIDIYYFGALSGLQRFGTLVGYRIAANLAQLVLLAVLAIAGVASVPTVVTLYALVYVIPIVAIESVKGPVLAALKAARRPTEGDVDTLTRFAMASLVAGLAYGGVLGLDVVLVRVLAPSDLASYGAARALTMPMTMIPLALGVVLLPRVAATPEAERRQLLLRAVRTTALLTLAVGAGYLVLGGLAVAILFPASYADAVGTLRALVPALGLLGIYGVLSQWCLGAGFPRWPATSLTAGAVIGAGADFVLIPLFGGRGAALGMTVGLCAAIALLGRRLSLYATPDVVRGAVRSARTHVGSTLRVVGAGLLLTLFGAAVAAGYGFQVAAILIAIVGVVLVIERPLVGGLIMVSAVPALSGLNRGLPLPGLRLGEILVVGIFFLVLISTRSAGWRRFDSVALLYVTGTLVLGATDLALRGAPFSLDDVSKLLGPLEFFLLYRVVLATASTARARSRMLRWMFLASLPVAVLALLQFVNFPGTRAVAVTLASETDSLQEFHTLYRATALFAQGHLLGSFMMLVILVGLALMFDSRPLPLQRRLLIGILIVDAFSMAATATLTPVLGLVAGSFALAYWYRRVGRTAITAAIAALVIAFAFGSTVSARYDEQFSQPGVRGGTPSTLAFRWQVWTQQYLPTVRTHLVTGYGPDLPPGAVWKATESLYVTLLLRGGLPLLLIYVWLTWTVGRSAWRIDDDRRPVARTMVVLTGILAILHTQNNYFIDSGFPQLWWALAGIVLAGSLEAATESAGRLASQPRIGLARGRLHTGNSWPDGAVPSW